MSKNENTKIKLQAVIDAIEEATESYTSFYDTKTKETVYLPDAFMTGETDEALLELLENEPDRFLRFPTCLLYTSPSPRDAHESRMPSSA